MRIYLNTKEAITDIGRELKKCATNVHTTSYQNKQIGENPMFETKEIQAYQFMIIDTSDKDTMPNVTLEWCKAEFAERISQKRVNPGKAYLLREEVWNEFLVDRITPEMNAKGEEDYAVTREFDYSYNERIAQQIPLIINELTVRPATRQAIIEVHNNMLDLDSLGGKKRIPCSLLYQFMVRDGRLDIIYVMRSTDFATHFQNDIWLADELRKYIATQVGLPRGKFIMFASSLHVYRKDWALLSNY